MHLLTSDSSVIHFLGRFAKIPVKLNFLCGGSLGAEVSIMRLWIRSNEGKHTDDVFGTRDGGDNNGDSLTFVIEFHPLASSSQQSQDFLSPHEDIPRSFIRRSDETHFPIVCLWFEKIPSYITFRSSDLRRKSLWIQSCENRICWERLLWLHSAAGKSLSRL